MLRAVLLTTTLLSVFLTSNVAAVDREKIKMELQTYYVDVCNDTIVTTLLPGYLRSLDYEKHPEDTAIGASMVYWAPFVIFRETIELTEAFISRITRFSSLDVLSRKSALYDILVRKCEENAKNELVRRYGTFEEFAKPENLKERRRRAHEVLQNPKYKNKKWLREKRLELIPF